MPPPCRLSSIGSPGSVDQGFVEAASSPSGLESERMKSRSVCDIVDCGWEGDAAPLGGGGKGEGEGEGSRPDVRKMPPGAHPSASLPPLHLGASDTLQSQHAHMRGIASRFLVPKPVSWPSSSACPDV